MTTIYDPHWDQHLRLLVFASAAIANSGFVRRAFLPLFSALERAHCTTIVAAKELIGDSGCLKDVPLELRSIFKGLVAQAPLEGSNYFFALNYCCTCLIRTRIAQEHMILMRLQSSFPQLTSTSTLFAFAFPAIALSSGSGAMGLSY
jgi:hypothetical protein